MVLSGHYVVICGYDADTDEFEIRDPASSRYSNLNSFIWTQVGEVSHLYDLLFLNHNVVCK